MSLSDLNQDFSSSDSLLFFSSFFLIEFVTFLKEIFCNFRDYYVLFCLHYFLDWGMGNVSLSRICYC